MINTIKDYYTFPKMYAKIKEITDNCEICIKNKTKQKRKGGGREGLLGYLGPAQEPFEIMSLRYYRGIWRKKIETQILAYNNRSFYKVCVYSNIPKSNITRIYTFNQESTRQKQNKYVINRPIRWVSVKRIFKLLKTRKY